MLHLLAIILSVCFILFADAVKDDEDPHYREMNKQVRNNAGLTLLLKEDLQADDFTKLHGRTMDNYHELLISVFKRTGIKYFDYSCSVRESFKLYHSVQEVRLRLAYIKTPLYQLQLINRIFISPIQQLSQFVGHEDCSDEKIRLSNSTGWQVQVTLGFNWVPSVKPEGSKFNVYICIDNVANRGAIVQNMEILNLVTSYDLILLPSQDLVDSYTKYLYDNLLLDVHVQAPIIALATSHPNKESFVNTMEFLLIDGLMASDFKKFAGKNVEKLRNCPTKPTKFQIKVPSDGYMNVATDYNNLRKTAIIIEPRITPTIEYVLR